MHHQFTHEVDEPFEHFVRKALIALYQQGQSTMATVADLVAVVSDLKTKTAAVEAEVKQLSTSPVPDSVVADITAVNASLDSVLPAVTAAAAATTTPAG